MLAKVHLIRRLFLDAPGVFARTLDVKNFSNRIGLGSEIMMNVGTHYVVARGGGGAVFSLEPQADDLKASFKTAPFVRMEIGVGPYRTNGNQCANHHQNAFTAQGRVGVLYDFLAKKTDFPVGVELGYFYIRDEFKNSEIFLRSDFYTNSKIITADFGLRFFLNLRADRSRY